MALYALTTHASPSIGLLPVLLLQLILSQGLLQSILWISRLLGCPLSLGLTLAANAVAIFVPALFLRNVLLGSAAGSYLRPWQHFQRWLASVTEPHERVEPSLDPSSSDVPPAVRAILDLRTSTLTPSYTPARCLVGQAAAASQPDSLSTRTRSFTASTSGSTGFAVSSCVAAAGRFVHSVTGNISKARYASGTPRQSLLAGRDTPHIPSALPANAGRTATMAAASGPSRTRAAPATAAHETNLPQPVTADLVRLSAARGPGTATARIILGPIPGDAHGSVKALQATAAVAATATAVTSVPNKLLIAAASAASVSAAVAAATSVGRSAGKRVGVASCGSGQASLKAPVGLSRCTIAEDAPFPPLNTQVVMELEERTVRVGGRRLRYRGYRPTDRVIMPPLPPVTVADALGMSASATPSAAAAASAAAMAPYSHLYHHDLQQYHQHLALQQYHHHHQQHQLVQQAMMALPHHQAHLRPATQITPLPGAHMQAQTQAQAQTFLQAAQSRPGSHVRMSIKFPWANPTDLMHQASVSGGLVGGHHPNAGAGFGGGGGGLLESLNAALSSGSGYMVVGAAIRSGCLLLQVEMLQIGEEDGRAGDVVSLVRDTARAVGALLPAPPRLEGDGAGRSGPDVDGGTDGLMLVDYDGRAMYGVSCDADDQEWSAVPLLPGNVDGGTCDGAAEHGKTTSTTTAALKDPWRLLQVYGLREAVRLKPSGHQAVIVPATDVAVAGTQGSPNALTLTLCVEISDARAAAQLTQQLQRQASSHAEASEDGTAASCFDPRGHAAKDFWQLAANCLGRSLPLSVLQVGSTEVTARRVSIDSDGSWSSSDDEAIVASITAEDDAGGDAHADADTSGAVAGNTGAKGAVWRIEIDLAVEGSREALDAAACRLGLLSVELWRGPWQVGQVPYMLVHDAVGLPQCLLPLRVPRTSAGAAIATEGVAVDASTGFGFSLDAARGLRAELCELPRDAGPDCLPQLFHDLATLELYVASVRHAARGAGSEAVEGSPALQQEQQQASRHVPLRPGSFDLSGDLQRQLAAAGPTGRSTMMLIGANLLSYMVQYGMPFAASAVRECLVALGCDLAEADALSADEAAAQEVAEAGAARADHGNASGGGGSGSGGEDPLTDDGLPLVHLAVLSGRLDVVRLVLQWAQRDGLSTDWVLRSHRGRAPQETAAAALAAAVGAPATTISVPAGPLTAAENGTPSDPRVFPMPAEHKAYLRQLEALLRPPAHVRGRGSTGAGEDKDGAWVPGEVRGGDWGAPSANASTELTPAAAVSAHGPSAAAPLAVAAVAAATSGGRPDESVGNAVDGVYSAADGDNSAECGSTASAAVLAASPDASCCGGGSSLRADRASQPLSPRPRHPLLICILGYADPLKEARFRSFNLSYDATMASYWVPLMCLLLTAALLRRFRTGGGGGAEASESRVSLAFAWPYVLLTGALLIRPSWGHRHLPAWWLLCGAARLSTKPLVLSGLLPLPPSMVQYTRSGVTMVTDTLLPALCERLNGRAGLLLRALDTGVNFWFVYETGVTSTLLGAVVYAFLRTGLYLTCAMAVERHRRARFEVASAAAGGMAAGGRGGGGNSAAAAAGKQQSWMSSPDAVTGSSAGCSGVGRLVRRSLDFDVAKGYVVKG